MPSLKDLPHVATGSILRRINLAEYATSSKIEALCEELVNMRKTSPGSKAIVFSQFVSMIDLIRWRLHSDPCLANMGLGVRALHGSMDVKARDASLKEFREDGKRPRSAHVAQGRWCGPQSHCCKPHLPHGSVGTYSLFFVLLNELIVLTRHTNFFLPSLSVEPCGRDAGNRSYSSSRYVHDYESLSCFVFVQTCDCFY